MVACWTPFCISPGCSVGPVTTSTKDQMQNISQYSCNVKFILLTLSCWCLTATGRLHSTTVNYYCALSIDHYWPWYCRVLSSYLLCCTSHPMTLGPPTVWLMYLPHLMVVWKFLLENSSSYIFILFWGFLPILIVITHHFFPHPVYVGKFRFQLYSTAFYTLLHTEMHYIWLNFRLFLTKILTPPFIRFFCQMLAPKV
jgi:hypothetical protein